MYSADTLFKVLIMSTGAEMNNFTEEIFINKKEEFDIKYDESRPEGSNIYFIGNYSYIEETDDGRTILHKDRGNYISIGQGFIDAYWNDGKGNKGSKRLNR